MRKRMIFWGAVLAAWVPFAAAILIGAGFLLPGAASAGGAAGVLAVLAVCVGALAAAGAWLVAARRFAFAAAMRFSRASLPPRAETEGARVLLVWDASHGFDAGALSASRRQDRPLLRTVIVDDGSDTARRRAVQNFAIRHNNVEIFTAEPGGAALNALLLGRNDYDYCVFAGADARLSADFVRRALDYFAEEENCGGVAGRIAEVGEGFVSRAAAAAAATAAAERAVRERFGADGLSASGVVLSRACIEGAGGFAYVEDPLPCFAAEANAAGFRIRFAPDVVCARAPRSLSALCAEHRREFSSVRAYVRMCAGTGTPLRAGAAERTDLFFEGAERALWLLTLLSALCAAALASVRFFVWLAVCMQFLTALLLYGSSAAEAFAANGSDAAASLTCALLRFSFDFGGPLALPRSEAGAAARAGASAAVGVGLLLFAGLACGNVWTLVCSALGFFLAPAAVWFFRAKEEKGAAGGQTAGNGLPRKDAYGGRQSRRSLRRR